MATLPPNLKVTRDQLAKLHASLAHLVEQEVLVGFPEETNHRDAEEGEQGGITNAALGYIHDNGAPEENIPARPFMLPGIENAKPGLIDKLSAIARRIVVSGWSSGQVDAGLEQVGILAATAIKNKVNEGIPPPLADSTLQARAKKGRKGAKAELLARSKGEAPSTQLAKPLIDTAQLRNAITYVVRRRQRD